MHYLHFVPTLLAVAFAAPQEVNFKKIDEQLPERSTVPVTAKPTIITYDPTAAIESVEEAVPTLLHKRIGESPWDNSGCSSCQAQPTIQNYYNVAIGSDTAFLADTVIAAKASDAPTPSGYNRVFTNLKAASNGYVYMGYTVVNAYTPSLCADRCNAMAGCASFNICRSTPVNTH